MSYTMTKLLAECVEFLPLPSERDDEFNNDLRRLRARIKAALQAEAVSCTVCGDTGQIVSHTAYAACPCRFARFTIGVAP